MAMYTFEIDALWLIFPGQIMTTQTYGINEVQFFVHSSLGDNVRLTRDVLCVDGGRDTGTLLFVHGRAHWALGG